MTFTGWATVAVLGVVAYAMAYAPNANLLMPGPISTAHSSNAKCSNCHTNLAAGKLGWMHALVSFVDPVKDSTACGACHKMGKNALSPHGLATAKLRGITQKQKITGTVKGASLTARLEKLLFPANDVGNRRVFCASCHKEHRGKHNDLTTMSDGQCDTCHNVKSESFENRHPEFINYPFKRRSRIIFDHSAHFKAHFPETKKKKRDLVKIPNSCADCHSSEKNIRHMSTRPFTQTCSSCHLAQIIGTERATGPKGVALLSLPGLDLKTLKEKNLDVGEWPAASEAEISPFMKLLLGSDEQQRKLITVVGKLDLLDLGKASDADLAVVVEFVWQVKGLLYALTTSKASAVMQRLNAGRGTPLKRHLMARLIATMPRDVLLGARRDWLPRLDKEMKAHDKPGWVAATTRSANLAHESRAKGPDTPAAKSKAKTSARSVPLDRLVTNSKYGRWRINVLGDLVQEGEASAPGARSGTEDVGSSQDDTAIATKGADANAKKTVDGTVALDEQSKTAIDAETWTEFGGWYRKDFAILYRPTGHADTFLRSWLDFSGELLDQSETNPSTAVFNLLTGKDAQGQCAKCHSIDGNARGTRSLQWRPSSPADKRMKFTKFLHEPHFRLLDDRGCLTCHELNAPKKLSESYKTHNPASFISNFKQARKKLCAQCHKKNAARQDCLLCHNYHVAPIEMPITSTKLPSK